MFNCNRFELMTDRKCLVHEKVECFLCKFNSCIHCKASSECNVKLCLRCYQNYQLLGISEIETIKNNMTK